MYDLEVDTTMQARSFRDKKQIINIKLEMYWWDLLEQYHQGKDLKFYILEWTKDAEMLGCNRSQLVRIRINQIALHEEHYKSPGPTLPALAESIQVKDAHERECPFPDMRTGNCRTHKCKYWKKDSRLRGFGKCSRLEKEILSRCNTRG